MKFSKSIIGLALASMFFIGCKESSSKPADEATETTTKKEIAAATKPETASFKIEGRMKSAEYVYTTVKAYKKAIDGNCIKLFSR